MQNDDQIRNELVIQGTRIGVWDWNIQTGETFFNERWAEIIGYTLEELAPISIETWVKFAHPEDLEKSNTYLENHFNGKSEYYDFQSRMKHKDGHWVWVHDRGKVFEWDKEGKPLRMCGSHIDITAEKENEIRLQNTIEERNLLLNEVHHRVKNNLQLLMSFANLKDNNGIINTYEFKESIQSIARAYEVIYQTKNIGSSPVKNYLDKIIAYFENTQNIKFELNIDKLDKGIDFLIPIGLILNELINNSIKYAFEHIDQPNIKIDLTNSESDITIIYKDNGEGYSDSILKNLDSLTSFGIMITKSLIQRLRGEAKFYNNNGACVELIIKQADHLV